MTEFVLSTLLSTVLLAAAAGLLHTQWLRVECAHATFEAAHARMIGGAIRPDPRVRVQEGAGHQVVGFGSCGSIRERVELRKLEALQ